jgi:cellulose synthase/poly-beta-1,6-N-acetylglucosamine synthase-like glycosyltransferase
MNIWLEQVLWFSVGTVVFVTAGYPIFLALAAPLLRRPWHVHDAEPLVSLIIAAHNEERAIGKKLDNALGLDYPRDRLEIIVASDGSTDRTDPICQSFADRGVVLRRFPRMGKTGIQNAVAKTAAGEILVFSDANAMYQPDAIRKLVRNFSDPQVGCVCGQLMYRVEREGAGKCERRYWDYEKFMKRRESELSSLIGANGSIYAVRHVDYVEIPDDLISDFVEPLMLVARGRRVVYEPEAISIEDASTSYADEFRRKVRILTRSINGLLHMRALLNPFGYGIFSLQLLMHKLLRYLLPAFLAMAFASLTALAVLGQYTVLFFLSAVLLGVSLVEMPSVERRSNPVVRVCHISRYYLLVNYALVLAWVNIFRGRRMRLWTPERKEA